MADYLRAKLERISQEISERYRKPKAKTLFIRLDAFHLSFLEKTYTKMLIPIMSY